MTSNLITLDELIKVRLEAIDGLLVGVGQVPEDAKQQGQPAFPYAVIYSSPGRLSGERYDDQQNQFSWDVQITVASGDEIATKFYISEVRDALTGVRLEPDNRAAGKLREVTDPGSARRDDENLADVRFWAPLYYRHTTTRS